MNDFLKAAAIAATLGLGATVVIWLADQYEPEPEPFDPTRVPGFLDLVRGYSWLLAPENQDKTYAIDPAHKIHLSLDEPIEEPLFPGLTKTRYVADMPRFVCADGDDSVSDSLTHSAREAFNIIADKALDALQERPWIMNFYKRHPGASSYISGRIIDGPKPSLN